MSLKPWFLFWSKFKAWLFLATVHVCHNHTKVQLLQPKTKAFLNNNITDKNSNICTRQAWARVLLVVMSSRWENMTATLLNLWLIWRLFFFCVFCSGAVHLHWWIYRLTNVLIDAFRDSRRWRRLSVILSCLCRLCMLVLVHEQPYHASPNRARAKEACHTWTQHSAHSNKTCLGTARMA